MKYEWRSFVYTHTAGANNPQALRDTPILCKKFILQSPEVDGGLTYKVYNKNQSDSDAWERVNDQFGEMVLDAPMEAGGEIGELDISDYRILPSSVPHKINVRYLVRI